MFFRMVYKSGQIFLPFCHNPRVWRTDRQTDRRTDRILLAIPRLHYMQRGKNGVRCTQWTKKTDILFLTVTLANLNRFLLFLYHFNRE